MINHFNTFARQDLMSCCDGQRPNKRLQPAAAALLSVNIKGPRLSRGR